MTQEILSIHPDDRISQGVDSIVFMYPGDPSSILKAYPILSDTEVQLYHVLQNIYAKIGAIGVLPASLYERYAHHKGWNCNFLGHSIRGAMVQVLFLGEDIKKEGNVVFTKVPYVSGKNLASYMEGAQTEEQSLPLYVLEDLAHTGLEILGLKLEKREKGKGIIQVGHNIGRDNIMIRGITNGIIDIVITDIGLDIGEALVAEENISASLK